jgi:hypothetical protein
MVLGSLQTDEIGQSRPSDAAKARLPVMSGSGPFASFRRNAD